MICLEPLVRVLKTYHILGGAFSTDKYTSFRLVAYNLPFLKMAHGKITSLISSGHR